MKTQTQFKPYQPNQLLLLPPDMRQWLPEDDLSYFIMDVVNELDLSAIYQSYDSSKGGQPPFAPKMMTSLLLYAYCVGIPSSHKIEKATYYQIPFRVIAADQHPDHDTIAEFRKRHLKALSGLFVQALLLCREVGLVKLGHVSLDGTKVKANASKHKAMSYGRMEKKAEELEGEVKRLLADAQAVDDAEDARYGKDKRGDELPKELRFKQDRLRKIKEAMKSLEADSKAEADGKREEIRLKEQTLEKEGRKRKGRKPKDPSDKPGPKAQRNFTDPESRIMKDGASKSFEQAYNCQAAVDEESQIIVATNVTQQANDKQQLEPLVEEIKKNADGQTPEKLSADSGCSNFGPLPLPSEYMLHELVLLPEVFALVVPVTFSEQPEDVVPHRSREAISPLPAHLPVQLRSKCVSHQSSFFSDLDLSIESHYYIEN